jgi:restriction system protein
MANRRTGQGDIARWQQAQLRQAERDRKAAESASRADYLAGRKHESQARTDELDRWVTGLQQILVSGLRRSAVIDLRRYRRTPAVQQFEPGPLAKATAPPQWTDFEPAAPGLLSGLTGAKSRYPADLEAARQRFAAARSAWAAQEQHRLAALEAARADHDRKVARARAEAESHNRALAAEIAGLAEREREPVQRYLQQVLKNTELPPSFPRSAEVVFNPHGEQAVVQLQLPGTEVVPKIKAVRYVQSRDEMQEVRRPDKEGGETYRDVIAQVALLTLRDLFTADRALQDIAFNGHVDAVDPATGKREYPCVVSLNVERDKFGELVLDQVSPADCLRHLNAVVSPHPYDLAPIAPIIDFDRSKYSFVAGLDAVATLDHRPDLMLMSPTEFEHLVRQIFEAMGMQGWTTRPSKDDGVDAVVFNPVPLLGGQTIVQAKRYKDVVGVNHIRELAGAMEEKKAGRGILVTTSWFTPGGRVKAHEHGRMELVDGPILVHLIKEHLGKDVLIGIKRPKNSPNDPPLPS